MPFIIPGPVFGEKLNSIQELSKGPVAVVHTVAAKSWGYAESRCLCWSQSTWRATYTSSSKSGVFVWLWPQSVICHRGWPAVVGCYSETHGMSGLCIYIPGQRLVLRRSLLCQLMKLALGQIAPKLPVWRVFGDQFSEVTDQNPFCHAVCENGLPELREIGKSILIWW